MKIFALSDLHLSLSAPADFSQIATLKGYKPMDIFGRGWENHISRIYENWQVTVGTEDVVLIPGDISWAMTLEEARFDLDFVGHLKGRKILLRGNHDYWWHSVAKIRKILPPGIEILQNNAIVVGDMAITGSRLWSLPGTSDFSAEDQKIYDRELIRLELSLKEAKGRPVINMTHYMPVNENGDRNDVIDLLLNYEVQSVVYGHLHDKSHRIALEGSHWGMDFHLVSGDYLGFVPKLIVELP
ncbi:MAG TPA: metallophosphoesterase [Firmicutes bacterium]|nr:metallophosphoesterase [Bacillota bacterium]